MASRQRLDQLHKPDTFNDALSASAVQTLESTAVDFADFQEGYLTQLNRILGSGNWYDPVASVSSDPRSLKTITDDIYYKHTMRRRAVLVDVTVPGGQNYVVLSAAGSETPGEAAAVGAGSANGAVVALLAGGSGSHSLNEVTGYNAVTPKNLLIIRDATTFDPILDSSNREIFGLLQAESVTVDGDTFNDTNNQAQISFVVQNSSGDDLIAAAAGDIGGHTINYSYVSRTQLYLMNEQDFLTGTFADPQTAAANTLQQAYIGGNQIDVLTAEGDLIVNLSQDGTEFEIQRGGANFMKFTRNDTTGDVLQMDADTLDVNLTNDADFNQGIKADTGGTTINIGVTAGQIDASALALVTSVGDLRLVGADDVIFRTVRQTTDLPLDDATAGAISALPGGPYASVSAAIKSALQSADLDIFLQVLQNNYGQDVNVPGGGNGNAQDWSPSLDLSARSIDMGTPASVDTVIFLNGRLLIGGNGTTNNDVYKGTTPGQGDLKYDFPKGVKSGDWVLALSWKAA